MSDALAGLGRLVAEREQRAREDAKRFAEHDGDLCMLCHAYGADKRSLILSCFYAVEEAVPEAIDLDQVEGNLKGRGYYLRICKACRGDFLGRLREWRDARVARRDLPKDHDGHEDFDDPDRQIPVRVNGTTVMMSDEEYTRYAEKNRQKVTP